MADDTNEKGGAAAPTGFDFPWSREAVRAFLDAALDKDKSGRLHVIRGLNAAMTLEAERICAALIQGMVTMLTEHPVLGQRVLVLKADPDGMTRLKLDRDLCNLLLWDQLPDGSFFSAPTTTTETPEGVAP